MSMVSKRQENASRMPRKTQSKYIKNVLKEKNVRKLSTVFERKIRHQILRGATERTIAVSL
jgi:hypothetical protein